MKLLVSDYDGTFNEDKNISKINSNIDAVKRFMDNGNLFAFATGRSFDSIKGETSRYKIPYDYLICNNGSAIFDRDDNLIFQNTILIDTVKKTLRYLNKFGFIKSIELMDAYGRTTANYNEATSITCTLRFRNTLDTRKVMEEISFLSAFSFMNVVVFKEEFDKRDGIYIVSDIEGVNKKDIYTIGDASNDKGMLLEFNGYKMPYSYPEIIFSRARLTSSVKSLVKKIERKSHE